MWLFLEVNKAAMYISMQLIIIIIKTNNKVLMVINNVIKMWLFLL